MSLIADGGVAAQVAKQLGMSANWISETVHRYNEGGVDGVKNKSKNEGSKTLTGEQVKELEKEIESGKTGQGKVVEFDADQAMGQREDGKGDSQNNRLADVCKIGVSRGKFRVPPIKSGQVKNTKPSLKKVSGKGLASKTSERGSRSRLWSEDEARFGLQPIIKKRWAKKGTRPNGGSSSAL